MILKPSAAPLLFGSKRVTVPFIPPGAYVDRDLVPYVSREGEFYIERSEIPSVLAYVDDSSRPYVDDLGQPYVAEQQT